MYVCPTLSVWVYVCVFVWACVCFFLCVPICQCPYMSYVSVFLCMCVCVCVPICQCPYMSYVSVFLYMCVCVCVSPFVSVPTCPTRRFFYAYVCVCVCVPACLCPRCVSVWTEHVDTAAFILMQPLRPPWHGRAAQHGVSAAEDVATEIRKSVQRQSRPFKWCLCFDLYPNVGIDSAQQQCLI